MTIFKKIIERKIPAKIVYEDDQILAFEDVQPQAPIHILIIPKKEIPTIQDLHQSDAALLGHLWTKIPEIAQAQGCADHGYRVVANCKSDGGQSVSHLHFHILGGRALSWPPG